MKATSRIVPVLNTKGEVELFDMYVTLPYEIRFLYQKDKIGEIVPANVEKWLGSRGTVEQAQAYIDYWINYPVKNH